MLIGIIPIVLAYNIAIAMYTVDNVECYNAKFHTT